MLSDTDKMASGCQLLCGHDDRTGHDHDKPSPWSIRIGSVMSETTETDRLHRTEHIIVVLMEYFNIFDYLTNPPRCILGSSWTHVRAPHIWQPRFPQSDALALTYVYRALCTINIYFWWFTELFSLLWGSKTTGGDFSTLNFFLSLFLNQHQVTFRSVGWCLFKSWCEQSRLSFFLCKCLVNVSLV